MSLPSLISLEAQARSSYRLDRTTATSPSRTTENPGESRTVLQVQAPEQNVRPSLSGIAAPFLGAFLSAPPSRTASPAPPVGFAGQLGYTLATTRLKKLENRDIVVLVDKSKSMETEDCATKLDASGRFVRNGGEVVSRWEWCRRETLHLAGQLRQIRGANLKVILYDKKTMVYRNVAPNSIPQIFNRFDPSGGTDTVGAIKEALDEHFAGAGGVGRNRRPTVIACITDGEISGARSLRELLVDATRAASGPREIAVSFLQVGEKEQRSKLLPELDNRLGEKGATFDLVTSRTFDQLRQIGLVTALVEAAS